MAQPWRPSHLRCDGGRAIPASEATARPGVDRHASRSALAGRSFLRPETHRRLRLTAPSPRVFARGNEVTFRYRHETIGPGVASLPDAGTILSTEPDFEYNRVIITIDRLSDRQLWALTLRYGTGAIAIRVAPGQARYKVLSRDNDVSPFWSGALAAEPAGWCSSGFSRS